MKQYLYIAFGCFVVAALALFVLLSGCTPRFDPCWPGFEQPDTSHKYVCSRASKGLHVCLNEHGYDSYIVAGKLDNGEYHSRVEVHQDGQVWWLDPAWDQCWKKDQWDDMKVLAKYRIAETGIVDWEKGVYR